MRTTGIKKILVVLGSIVLLLFFLVLGLNPEWLTKTWETIKGKFSSKKGQNKQTTQLGLLEYIKKYYKPDNFKLTGNLDEDIVDWIKVKEGGIVTDKDDSASSDPIRGTFNVKGKRYVDPHTNKGITWAAFKDTLGTRANSQLFFEMPDDVWLQIYRNKYVNPVLGETNNKLLNYELANWAWGSGRKGEAMQLADFEKRNGQLHDIVAKDKMAAFEALVLDRIKFFERLAISKPTNQKYLAGWINRKLNFYNNFKRYI